MKAILLLIMSVIPPTTPVLHDHVDRVEHNYKYDQRGRLTFKQFIFYDWDEESGRFQVVAWKMDTPNKGKVTVTFPNGGVRLSWMDYGVPRIVDSPQWQETWTFHDPELLEREILPKSQRRGLTER